MLRRPQQQGNPKCQKCYQKGHWTYECKGKQVYLTRPSRTDMLKNPSLKPVTNIQEHEIPEVPRITDHDKYRDPYYWPKNVKKREEEEESKAKEAADRQDVSDVESESSVSSSSSSGSSSSNSDSDSSPDNRKHKK
eukprot:Trichotokara_eunicae@DN6183_c0_g1_i1.p2